MSNLLSFLDNQQQYYNVYIPRIYHFTHFTMDHLEPFLRKNHKPPPLEIPEPCEEMFFTFDEELEYELIEKEKA